MLDFFNRYYHELFLRSRPDLCRDMIRTRVKGTARKKASSPDSEPNFYQMEYCGAAIDSFFDRHLDSSSLSVCDMDGGAVNRQKNGSRSRTQLTTSGRKKRRIPRMQRRVSIDSDNRNDWTASSTLSPGIGGVSSNQLIMPSFIEVNTSIDIPTEDSIFESDDGSVKNWIQSYFSGAVLDSSSVRAPCGEFDHVAGIPIASVTMDESGICLDSPDSASECSLLDSDDPCTGDVAFFERQPFCYLEHINFDSFPATADDGETITPLQPDNDDFTIDSLDSFIHCWDE
jgi:hypothetical protein